MEFRVKVLYIFIPNLGAGAGDATTVQALWQETVPARGSILAFSQPFLVRCKIV
jgi:hypothetical protein